MNTRNLRSARSTETPMDFEFTSRASSNTKPAWAVSEEDPHTPKKRTHTDLSSSTPSFRTPGTPSWPTFGQHNNVPFLFRESIPQSPNTPAWVPTSSPTKPVAQPELHDIDMNEGSPSGSCLEKQQDQDGERAMAVGALRRVFKKRSARDRSLATRRRARVDDAESGTGESDEEEDQLVPIRRKTTNHYTLNMAGSAAPQSDLPFRLLGFVQLFFNASLAAIAIYLLVQFILTIQRDVEYRIAEYSMEIVQEIAQCQLAYKTNLCAQGAVPAMTAQCAAWETCMNRDPTKVGRAKVGFEVVGEVINSFFDQISWKTLSFTIAALAFMTVFINSVLTLFRSRVDPATHHTPPPGPPYPMVAGMPYHVPHRYLSPPQDFEFTSKPWNRIEHDDDEAAPRRRRLEGGQAAKVK